MYSHAGVGHREQLAELDLRGPFVLACLVEPVLPAGGRVGSGVHLGAPAAARELLYVTGCGLMVRYRPADVGIYDPVHGSPITTIKTAGGAGGARTHDRRIMRNTAPRIVGTTCTDTAGACRRWR